MKREFIPGIVHGLDIEAYHAMEPVSKSGLDSIDLSPAIFYARHLDPNRPPAREKSGQLEGHLAHCAILEPEEFEKRYIIGPTLNRNTKEWKSFVAAHPERVAIQHDQYEAAARQATSVRALPEIGDVLASGMPEVSAFWVDEETGAECRCRPDFVHDVSSDSVILLDVKTFSDPSPNEFARQCARKAYAKQAAFYSDGYEKASGKTVRAFIFLAVGNEWPYAASAMMLDEESLEAGRRQYKRNLRTYAECMKTNTWPGFSNGITLIRLPQWALTTEE
ncbi:PD-(D/E)XK nuclease-like domain-containing protein [Caballeronia sp. ATUFL_M1_KS5A]|uniref:PD-(D/E)XK nuclease-like domain-containing protein n=1 Tax=Caballeronia sp. ATUFL_M1_KS5A TaxID=2921778 RepID=UPI00202815E4|nr:PD-(D/E)XK nuclease-like domain-containing protein [Caballeronia sp. ATUFL_M1_KS5A]